LRPALKVLMSIALAAASSALIGCSATTFEYTECASNQACRDGFGHGSVCAEGLCSTVELEPRCNLDDGLSLPLSADDTIVVGTLFNRATESHLARERSARLAFDQAAAGDGLDGRDFVLVQCTNEPGMDDGLDQDQASLALARHLADEIGVLAIVGPSSSSRTQSAYVEVEPFGTLVISPSATSPALTALDGLEHSHADPGLLWRTAPPDTIQGPVIAGSMIDRGVEHAAVIHRADAYGEGLAQVVAEAFGDGARTIDLLPFSNEAGLVDQTVNAVEDATVQEVLFVSSDLSDVVGFLGAASTLAGFDGVDIFLTDAARNQDLLDQAEDAIDALGAIRGTSPALPTGSVYDAFKAGYAVAYDEDVSERSYTAHAYDAAWLVAYGAAWSHFQEGGISGLGVARGLRRISNGDDVEIRATGWSTVLGSFASGDGVDVIGASGELDYDPLSGETGGPIELWEISEDGDEFVVLDEVR
jgi:ABC-type branched-subunit amino acid transport system substrate-binding protein